MEGYSSSVDTEVDFCFIVEDNIYRLIINVQPELKPIKVLLPIVLLSSPAIANTFVLVAQLRYQHHVNRANSRMIFDVIGLCKEEKYSNQNILLRQPSGACSRKQFLSPFAFCT